MKSFKVLKLLPVTYRFKNVLIQFFLSITMNNALII